MNWWLAVVFSWLAILLALVLPVLGIMKRVPLLLVVSAVIAAPYSLYLGGAPRVGWLGFMIPALMLGASAGCTNYLKANFDLLL